MSKSNVVERTLIQPGPMCRESLPAAMRAKTKWVFDAIGPYLGMTLDQFERWFKADPEPEPEVLAWVNVALAWLAYHEKFLGKARQSDAEERRLLIALIAISTGVKDLREYNLPPDVGPRLLACYEDLGQRCSTPS
jgi:hypothetical protein